MKILEKIEQFDIQDKKTRKSIIKYTVLIFVSVILVSIFIGNMIKKNPYHFTKPYVEIKKYEKIEPFRYMPPKIERDFKYAKYIKVNDRTNRYFFDKLKPNLTRLQQKDKTLEHTDLFIKYAKK